MTIADLIAGRAARNAESLRIMDRARQPMTVRDYAIAQRQHDAAVAADQTACGDKCDTRIDGICEAHRKAVRGCVGHRHNRK